MRCSPLFLAGALAISIVGVAGAQTVPLANNCVSSQSLPDRSSGDHWYPKYRFTNGCPYEVTVRVRNNYGTRLIKCSGGHAFDIRPGGSQVFDAGPLPRGVQSYIRYCSHYDDREIQDRTGYADCYESNSPSCPQLQ